MPEPLLTPVEGRFNRIIRADRAGRVLAPPRPTDAGRYHAPGQAALYLSPTAEWARVAVSGGMAADAAGRLVFAVAVTGARVLDLRDEAACRRPGLDRERAALLAGGRPPSWDIADAARAAGADGLIDPSCQRPGAWHLALFRWNLPGGPQLRLDGEARPIG